MKNSKLIGLGMAAILSFAICAGCAPDAVGNPDIALESQHTASQLEQPNENQTPAPEKLEIEIPFAEGQQYAVAYLGFREINNWEYYQEQYHIELEDIPTYWVSDGDYYLVIPRHHRAGGHQHLRPVAEPHHPERRTIYRAVQHQRHLRRCGDHPHL